MDTKKYPVAFKVERGEFTEEQLKWNGRMGCDSIIVHSIIAARVQGDERNEVIFSYDEKGNDVDLNELFTSWVVMAKALSERPDLGANKKRLCKYVYDTVLPAFVNRSSSNGQTKT